MDEQKKIPRHVAIIMDGNGRWAERRKLPRKMGHAEGCKVLEQTVRDAADLGIDYLTVYAFSTENWKRSEEEVSALMVLMGFYIKKLLKVAEEENVRVKISLNMRQEIIHAWYLPLRSTMVQETRCAAE